MKPLLGVAALLFCFSLPAHAQISFSAGSALNNGSHVLPSYPTLSSSMTYAAGSSDFIPSTFLNYDQAVAVGRALQAEHAKTLAEVAKESRDREKTKAKMVIEQDADNRIVVANPH